MSAFKELTGKTFESGVTAIEFVEFRPGGARWRCRCHCGNEFIARGADLTNGHTTSCGCKNRKHIQKVGQANKGKYIKDITGQRFGKLVVLEPTEKRDSGRGVIWKCQCDCGNTIEVSAHALRQGQVSCGCEMSKGELKIRQLLTAANIPFETQKTFETCVFEDTGYLARFDFYVDNKYLIEYDGIQHFGARIGWNTEESFKTIQLHDEIKNKWCEENNIPLIRIPYTKYHKLSLEDLLIL